MEDMANRGERLAEQLRSKKKQEILASKRKVVQDKKNLTSIVITCLNVRSCNSGDKQKQVREWIQGVGCDIVSLNETKLMKEMFLKDFFST